MWEIFVRGLVFEVFAHNVMYYVSLTISVIYFLSGVTPVFWCPFLPAGTVHY